MAATLQCPEPSSSGHSSKHVAVVGSGITGLAAAWLLEEHSPHKVTLFESDARLGGHAHTVDYQPPPAAAHTLGAPASPSQLQSCPVDTGFIVYNHVTYPNLIRLFAHLKVPVKQSDMSFALSRDHGAFEWSGTSLATVFCQPQNLLRWRFWRMLYDIVRFDWEFTRFATDPTVTISEQQQGIGAWLAERDYSTGFIEDYLMPVTASVWSTPADMCAADFPAWTLARFLHNHRMLQLVGRPCWMTVADGSREYVKRIEARLKDARKSTGIISVRRTENDKVCITDVHGQEHMFDHVILACHADQALRLLGTAE
ncbi:hypothetical protein THASP1DRAFT_32469 [Thamnocephalis sphaerospora]|uniref:Amine oxidase domain-containing protein n=1 Tax=Thamnocephalis sphaerospora TaxID=78915 RepID=A0A4V1IVY6_9FUNG|nr:hypothetical protein THASP1DRAFT_32469 [Thamnocephalis sphaerospora]|eukprot:RKP05689.1 hypothetical protein THASP1DRAFT_32469 [Thamnocephalis sphaerospora]